MLEIGGEDERIGEGQCHDDDDDENLVLMLRQLGNFKEKRGDFYRASGGNGNL